MYVRKLNIKIISWLTFLMFTSGYTNCIALFYCGLPLYHHTGNITNIAIALNNHENEMLPLLIGAILSFFISGVISGMTFYKKHVGFSKTFGIMVIIQSILYIIINFFFTSKTVLIISTAFIAGAQNALLTRYNGITTRTTHLTGYLTDCSINLGRAIRGDKNAFRYFLFFLINIIAFFIGTLVGVFTVSNISVRAFFLVAIFRMMSGLFYLKFINKKDVYQMVLKND